MHTDDPEGPKVPGGSSRTREDGRLYRGSRERTHRERMLTYDVQLVELQPQPVAVVKAEVAVPDIPPFLGGAFDEVLRVLAAEQLAPAGPPFCRYASFGPTFSVEAGFPTTGVVPAAGRVVPEVLPGGTVARVLHVGDYAAVASAYEAATAWLDANGYVLAGSPWESYLDDPTVAQPRTVVFLPCRPVPAAVT